MVDSWKAAGLQTWRPNNSYIHLHHVRYYCSYDFCSLEWNAIAVITNMPLLQILKFVPNYKIEMSIYPPCCNPMSGVDKAVLVNGIGSQCPSNVRPLIIPSSKWMNI